MIVDCAGETLHLLPERAVWWPAQSALLVADVHIGKAAAYRALGQPVPAGTTARNLARLDALVNRHRADRLIVLGDFVHAQAALRSGTLDALRAWRARTRALSLTVIAGNHDRRAGPLPPELAIASVADPLPMGSLSLSHVGLGPAGRYVLAGHRHPAWQLRGRGHESLRLPCFVFDTGGALLPAFGEFTGGRTLAAKPGRRIYVIGAGEVWQVPSRSRGGPGVIY